MAEITAVSKDRHANQTWQRPTNYFFAAKDPVATLVSQEVSRALLSMALGFIVNDGAHVLVAVQGFKPGQNKCVARDGRWLGDYVPAIYRAHPFRLGRNPEGVDVLCIDEAAAQVSDTSKGEPIFMPDGTPAPALAEAFRLLVEIEKDRLKTNTACAALARHGLLEPWPLRAQDGDEMLEVGGLFRIAESRLYALDASALAEIRDTGALMIAYGQLFSMHQVHKLGKLGAPNPQAPQGPSLNLSDQNGIISFGNL